MTKSFSAISLIAALLVSCTPQTRDCPNYCDDATGAKSLNEMHAACSAAFGDGFSVAVRTCPRGLVPAACASLSEYNDLVITCSESDAVPSDILCCWE